MDEEVDLRCQGTKTVLNMPAMGGWRGVRGRDRGYHKRVITECHGDNNDMTSRPCLILQYKPYIS